MCPRATITAYGLAKGSDLSPLLNVLAKVRLILLLPTDVVVGPGKLGFQPDPSAYWKGCLFSGLRCTNPHLPAWPWLRRKVWQGVLLLAGLGLGGFENGANAALPNVVINEVAARSQPLGPGTMAIVADWIELHNRGNTAIDLSGMSLTDRLPEPRRWVFPNNSSLPARSYKIILFDETRPVSPTNTGFNLKGEGEAVYLFHRPSAGGDLIDSVVFGWQLVNFTIGRIPNATGPWTLTEPTPAGANASAPLGNPSALKINEWLADPLPGEDDYIEIYNPTSLPIALGGLYISDEANRPTKDRIQPLNFVGADSDAHALLIADGVVTNGANHVGFRLSAGGETITLHSPNQVFIDARSFGPQATGVSEGRLPDGHTNVVRFAATPSPGDDNYLLLTSLVINEILAGAVLPLEDAIELLNPSNEAVDIGGWYMSDDRNVLKKFQFPLGTIIAPGEYKVFYEYQFNASPGSATSFALDRLGDELYCAAADESGHLTGHRAAVSFGASLEGVSLGRHANSQGLVEYVAMSRLTFGSDRPDSVARFRTGKGLPNSEPLVWPVVINEILFAPLNEGTNVLYEYIELYNHSSNPVALQDPESGARWALSNAVEFVFPANTIIPARSSLLVVSFNPSGNPTARAAFDARYGRGPQLAGPFRGSLDNASDVIELYAPGAPVTLPGPDIGKVPYVLVEKIAYRDRSPWPPSGAQPGTSLQRLNPAAYGNDPLNWVAVQPSAGAMNRFDSDSDQMPDQWERLFGLNPNDAADANFDPDSDGRTNLEEYRSGTHPIDASDVLRLAIELDGFTVLLRFSAAANKAYQIQHRSRADRGTWTKLADVAAAASARRMEVADVLPLAGGQRFYRILTP